MSTSKSRTRGIRGTALSTMADLTGWNIVTALTGRDWGVDHHKNGHRAVRARVHFLAAAPSGTFRRTQDGTFPVPLPRVSPFSAPAFLLGKPSGLGAVRRFRSRRSSCPEWGLSRDQHQRA